MKFGKQLVARNFDVGTDAHADFGHLSPLKSKTSWSVVALICPERTIPYAGIVAKRSGFGSGANQFTFWLKDGAVTVEADSDTRRSDLIPPLNEWSFVGAAVDSQTVRMYLGTPAGVKVHERPGLECGMSGDDLPLVIGRQGGSFPGSIAFVCLYEEKLDDDRMRAICAKLIDPSLLPATRFSWSANESGDADAISGISPKIIGTKLVLADAISKKRNSSESSRPAKQSSSGLFGSAMRKLRLKDK